MWHRPGHFCHQGEYSIHPAISNSAILEHQNPWTHWPMQSSSSSGGQERWDLPCNCYGTFTNIYTCSLFPFNLSNFSLFFLIILLYLCIITSYACIYPNSTCLIIHNTTRLLDSIWTAGCQTNKAEPNTLNKDSRSGNYFQTIRRTGLGWNLLRPSSKI